MTTSFLHEFIFSETIPFTGAAIDTIQSPSSVEPMLLSLQLDGLYYVSYVRVECDFNVHDFSSQKGSEEHSCLIAISFVNMDRGAEPETIVKGHTFNLLTTAHSSRKVSAAIISCDVFSDSFLLIFRYLMRVSATRQPFAAQH